LKGLKKQLHSFSEISIHREKIGTTYCQLCLLSPLKQKKIAASIAEEQGSKRAELTSCLAMKVKGDVMAVRFFNIFRRRSANTDSGCSNIWERSSN